MGIAMEFSLLEGVFVAQNSRLLGMMSGFDIHLMFLLFVSFFLSQSVSGGHIHLASQAGGKATFTWYLRVLT